MRLDHADRRLASRSGFTLLELMAALMLTGFAILGAQRLLNQLADGRDRLRAVSIQNAARWNRHRLLRDLIANVEPSPDSTQRFVGSDTRARFASWCLSPSGWLERCVVELDIKEQRDSSGIVATLDASSPTLWRVTGKVSLTYLENGRWLKTWSNALTVPSAVGIVATGDTLVLPIGAAP